MGVGGGRLKSGDCETEKKLCRMSFALIPNMQAVFKHIDKQAKYNQVTTDAAASYATTTVLQLSWTYGHLPQEQSDMLLLL